MLLVLLFSCITCCIQMEISRGERKLHGIFQGGDQFPFVPHNFALPPTSSQRAEQEERVIKDLKEVSQIDAWHHSLSRG